MDGKDGEGEGRGWGVGIKRKSGCSYLFVFL